MLRFCELETLSIRERMNFVPMQFMRPADPAVADRLPASIYLAPWWMRTIDRFPPAIGWEIEFKGHVWQIVRVRQALIEKGGRGADRYPVFYCKYMEEIGE